MTLIRVAPSLPQEVDLKKVYDAVIVGSGAAGGMAAHVLTSQGMNVLMLDAGTKFDRSKFWSHVKPWEVEDRLDRGQQPPQFQQAFPRNDHPLGQL